MRQSTYQLRLRGCFYRVSLDAHLTELRRDVFPRAGATSIGDLSKLKSGQGVKIGGLLVAVQRPPTAKGFAFLAVEDASGMVNVIVAPPVYEQCRAAVHSAFVLVEGVLQKDHGATPHCATPCGSVGASVNVVAQRIDAV